MAPKRKQSAKQSSEIQSLQQRLAEAEETLRAIRSGEVDALLVSDSNGSRVFTLQGAERPYRLLVEAMQEGAVTLSPGGLILYSNQRFAEMVGVPLEQVLGASIRSFIAEADRAAFEKLLSDVSHQKCHGEIALTTSIGDQLPCNFTLSLLSDQMQPAICLVATDLTEQKRIAALEQQAAQADERERLYEAEKKAHAEVQRTAKRISHLQNMTSMLSGALTMEQIANIVRTQAAIVEASTGTIALLDETKSLLGLVDISGYSNQETDALNPWNSFSVDAPVPLAEAARLRTAIWIESQDAWIQRYPHLAQTTARIDHQAWAMVPLITEKRLIGALGFAFPISHSFNDDERAFILTVAQQFAQALDRAILYRAEREARRQAESADLLKLQFLAMVSHELRTPLTSIKGFASTLLSTDVHWDANSQKSYLEIINEEANKLAELIEQLLDVSRLAAGKLNVNPQHTSLQAIIKRMLVRLETMMTQHRLQITIAPDLPAISADPDRIAQVISNLVSNAVKFSPPQSQISIAAFQREGKVQVNISDQGPGIPASERTNVFEAFRQLDMTSRNSKGAGLGLAICKGIIDAHAGEIWIADQQVPGTTVSFTIPISAR